VPEIQFDAIIFCMVAGMAVAAAALWSLKKIGAARRKTIHLPSGFLAGSVLFIVVYALNRLLFPFSPAAAAITDLGMLTGILAFPWAGKKVRRAKKKIRRVRMKAAPPHPLQPEADALERMLAQDPLNTFCHERLSELYEKMGRFDRALKAAQEAVRLDPTVKNRWRVEEIEGRMGRRP
jgi:cytochrome c-type biogenesis protein CcmH/NrfG